MTEPPSSIRQRRWLWGRIDYSFLDRDTLLARASVGRTVTESKIELSQFDPQPLRVKRGALLPLVGFVALALGALLCLVGFTAEGVDSTDDVAGLVTLFLVMAVPAAYCLVRWRRESCDLVVFRGHGGELFLLRDRPDAQTFSAFVQELERRIRNAGPGAQVPEGRSVGRELEALADLRARGILDEHEFQQAKERVLALLGGGEPMGFGLRAPKAS